MSPDDSRHGTRRGYYAHRKAGQDACEDCKRAAAAAEAMHAYNRSRGRAGRLDTQGTARRLQALVAMGWGYLALERETGIPDSELALHATKQRDYIFPSTAAKIAAAYDRLSMRLPPANTGGERQSITKAKRRAERNGWAGPLCWDDIDNDEAPDYGGGQDTDIDPVVVMRLLEGQRVTSTKAEKEAAMATWVADGAGSRAELARMHGWGKPERYTTALRLVEEAS